MRTRITLAVIPALAASAVAAAAMPAPARSPHKEQFTISGKETITGRNGPIKLVASGPISGTGTASFVDHGRSSKATFRLPDGRVFVIYTGKRFTLHLNRRKCTANIEYDGSFTIRGGTRHYRTATGQGTFTEHRHVVGQRDRAGKCLGRQAPPVASTNVNIATGTATL